MIRTSRLVRDVCLGLVLLAVAGCGGGSSNSTASSARTSSDFDFGGNNALKATAFGDSMTKGVLELKRRSFGLTTANNYPALLQSKLRTLDPAWVVVNRGVGGELTADGARRLPGTLQSDRPGYVLILEGSNDAQRCTSSAAVAGNLHGMVQTAKANRTIPLIGTLPPNFRHNACADIVIAEVNNAIRSIAAAEGIVMADIFNGMNNRALFGVSEGRDPLHPNELGYAVMADIWFQAMLQAIPGGATAALRRRR
jgi:lysophospholipase L1-like esterase